MRKITLLLLLMPGPLLADEVFLKGGGKFTGRITAHIEPTGPGGGTRRRVAAGGQGIGGDSAVVHAQRGHPLGLVRLQILQGQRSARGGGMIGDLAGFAAATYARGLPFVLGTIANQPAGPTELLFSADPGNRQRSPSPGGPPGDPSRASRMKKPGPLGPGSQWFFGQGYSRTTSATRRFWARPSLVALSATGLYSPYEVTFMRCTGKPCCICR